MDRRASRPQILQRCIQNFGVSHDFVFVPLVERPVTEVDVLEFRNPKPLCTITVGDRVDVVDDL